MLGLTHEGVDVGSAMEGYRGLFLEWRTLYATVARSVPQSGELWLTQLSLAPLLGSAAWRTGAIALSEFKTVRTHSVQNSNRLDLLLRDQQITTIIETENEWVDRLRGLHLAEAKLQKARRDVGSIVAPVADVRIALVFISFWINRDIPLLPLLDGAMKTFAANPNLARVWWAAERDTLESYCPGVMLVAERVQVPST